MFFSSLGTTIACSNTPARRGAIGDVSTIRISLSIDCLYLTLRIGLQSPPGSRVNGPARSHNTQSTPFSSSAVAVLDEASLFELTWHLCHPDIGNTFSFHCCTSRQMRLPLVPTMTVIWGCGQMRARPATVWATLATFSG